MLAHLKRGWVRFNLFHVVYLSLFFRIISRQSRDGAFNSLVPASYKKIFLTIHPSPLLGCLPRGAEAVVHINLGISANFLTFLFFVQNNGHRCPLECSAMFHWYGEIYRLDQRLV